ncbi:MAG: hypothetical protein GF311_22115 [Candidatus Lokiarchaeota archaeon]|nr:hypothetical protein [Candidatus Lokiarchaeota archaeon]
MSDRFTLRKNICPIKIRELFYGWPIPTTSHPLAFAIGRITKKPGIVDDKIEIREYLILTALFNHDVVDVAPATRFINDLKEKLESGYGLANL